MSKKAMIAILAVFVGLILVTMSVPLSQATIPPKEDYNPMVYETYYFDGWPIDLGLPSGEGFCFRFGLVGGQCAFVDPDSEPVATIAFFLCHGEDPRTDLERIVHWIHMSIDYAEDDGGWITDHWQTCAETLRLRSGDCEDMAILGASIAEAAGYDTVLVFGEDHVIFAMECDPLNIDYTVEYKGRTYVTADPTANHVGWPIDAECITDTMWTPFNIAFVSAQAFGVVLGIITIAYIWRRVE